MPEFPSEYLVPAAYGEAALVEKKSRFIGRVWPVRDETEALARLAETRARHWDATHNVYAYIIRQGPTRYSDDGEPQGASGQPTLNVFQSERIHNVCCVVTRYYGGVLLGAGGLVRAYSKTARLALEQAGVSAMRQWDRLLVALPYSLFERCKALLAARGGLVENSEFGAEVLLETLLPLENTAEFTRQIREISAGAITPQVVDTVFRAARIR